MDWTQLLSQVISTIHDNPSVPHQPGNDPGNLIGNITEMFMQQQQQGNQLSPDFMNQITQELYNNPSTPHKPGNDPGGLIGQLENVFMQQAGGSRGSQGMPAESASMDPMGDPAAGGGYTPASQDPYGDPASQ
jgi:hypothetical protein